MKVYTQNNKYLRLLESLTNKKVTLKERQAKRYVVVCDMYVYANDDKDAKRVADKIMYEINDKHDAHAEVKELYEMPFGSMTPRKINLSEAYQDDVLIPVNKQDITNMIKQAYKDLGLKYKTSHLTFLYKKINELQANEEGKLLTYGDLKKIINFIDKGGN
jgi:hypothetical protein